MRTRDIGARNNLLLCNSAFYIVVDAFIEYNNSITKCHHLKKTQLK